MKTYIIKCIGIICLTLVATSCKKDFLDLAPGQELGEEQVFGEYNNFKKYNDYTYNSYRYIAQLDRLFNVLQACMSDEATTASASNTLSGMRQGDWLAGVGFKNGETDGLWSNMYAGIRRTNLILEKIDQVPNFPSDEIKNRIIGENYFLRAHFYFELIKRFGGVPIVTRTLSGEENLDLPRGSYDDCVKLVVADCDRAAKMLPASYADIDFGRATEGAALALKSRMLLYAASPLNNPTNDVNKWRAAADAAKAVIDLNRYALYPDLHELFFQITEPEIILSRPRQKLSFDQGNTGGDGFWKRFIAPSRYSGWTGTSITLNFVDLYEMSNGYPIEHPKGNYNPQDPYANRDPRLKMDVMVHGVQWLGEKVDLSSNEGKPGITYNRNIVTGHTPLKFWPKDLKRYSSARTYLNFIVFRYAEILLNYAEALNEVEGPTQPVRDAINAVRKRAGQKDVPLDISSTKDDMRLRIQNERAVEFFLEEHRFYDLLRWKKGVQYLNGDVFGMRITKNANGTFKYERFVAEQGRVFNEYMHRYPIPLQEIYKSGNVLTQNEGWPK